MKENPNNDMDQEASRIAYLIAGFIKNTITEEEHDELDAWVNASDHNMLLFEDLTDEKNMEANLAWMQQVDSKSSFKKLQESGAFKKTGKRVNMKPVWMAAAALILIAAVFFMYRFKNNSLVDKNEVTARKNPALQPGGNRATLTLSDGTIIDLTAAKKGLITNKNGQVVNKTNEGELVYSGGDLRGDASAIHTLTTPVGGQYQLKLPDGTKVWLNAATTLRYPAHFKTSERVVEIDGEAYFEVAKNAAQPFRITLTDSSEVNVLGTHFNVMSYTNENAKEVTLVEGSVSVKSGNKTQTLLPGMQAKIAAGDLTRQTSVDTDEVTGWKDGLFVFHDAPIESIMRQVERWYDAEVVYKGKIAQFFNATIDRKEPLLKLLRLLELNGYVHFKIENKTIYVSP